jgi:hypothetical protein
MLCFFTISNVLEGHITLEIEEIDDKFLKFILSSRRLQGSVLTIVIICLKFLIISVALIHTWTVLCGGVCCQMH